MSEDNKQDWTRTIAWQAMAAPPAHTMQCQREALQHQLEMFEEAQRKAAAWTKRRQVALETGIDALKRMSACKDAGSAAAIYGEWVSGSLGRLLEDINDMHEHALRVTEHVGKASQALFAAPPAESETPAAGQQVSAAVIGESQAPSPQPAPTPMREAAD